MKTLSRLVLPQAPSPIMTSFLQKAYVSNDMRGRKKIDNQREEVILGGKGLCFRLSDGSKELRTHEHPDDFDGIWGRWR